MKLIRIAKALVGTATTWGLAWSTISIPTLVFVLRNRLDIGPSVMSLTWSWLANAWLFAFAQGAAMGVGFALLLLLLSRRVRALDRLSPLLAGGLGAVAAVGVSVLTLGTALSPLNALVVATLGAASATVLLHIARRAPDRIVNAPEEPYHLPTA